MGGSEFHGAIFFTDTRNMRGARVCEQELVPPLWVKRDAMTVIQYSKYCVCKPTVVIGGCEVNGC